MLAIHFDKLPSIVHLNINVNITRHYELHDTKKIFLIPVKIIDLWSYLKVFTGIKKKKIEKKIFFSMEKIFFLTSEIS